MDLAQITQLAAPLAESMGYELLLVETVQERGDWILRCYLDAGPALGRPIQVEDCERFSRALDPVLDIETSIQEAYRLEVSSPGLDRPLVKPEHFARQLGAVVQVQTKEALEGRRNFKGVLQELENGHLRLQIDEKDFWIPVAAIKRAHLDYFATQKIRK